MIDDGLKGREAAFADLDHDLIRLSYDTVDSPYPFLLVIPQSQTQRHLDKRFRELGGSVLRGVRLLDLVPEFPGSAASVVDSAGELRVINARFVAGCDGLHSRVRHQLGIGFPGSSPEQMFAVAVVRFQGWPADRVEPAFTLSPHGMLISSPLPKDMVRVVVPPETPAPTQHDVNDLIQTRGPSWMRPAGSAPGFNVTVSKDVSQPVAVRPDGIVASAELVHELFGFNLVPVLVASNEVQPPTDAGKGQEVSQQLVAHPALAQYEGAR